MENWKVTATPKKNMWKNKLCPYPISQNINGIKWKGVYYDTLEQALDKANAWIVENND